MSKVAGFIIGGIEVIAGVVLVATGVGGPLGVELIISGATTIAAQAVADLTMPKAPARQAAEMSLQLGEQPRAAFFGEGAIAGTLVDGFDYGGTYGTDWEVLIIRLADHKCASLTGFYVNDIWVPYTGDGLYPAFNTDHLAIYFRGDTSTVPLPAIVTTYGPGWTSSDIGGSGCDVIVAYRADEPKNKHPVWPGGRPRFLFVLKGALCYDPRKDSSVGGSGSHRWTDSSTWEWSENPVICRYNWARGIYANNEVTNPAALLVGRGLSDVEAPPANVFAAANLCDEVVGSGVRYRIAGPVYANQDAIDVEQMFALACAGSVVVHDGDVQVEPGQSKSIVATITDDDVLVGSKVSWNNGILSEAAADWVNTVVVNYVEPAQKYASHEAPPARVTADVLADGRSREASITLRLVKDLEQAQRIAEIQRRLGRLWGRLTVTLGPRFCYLEEGDWIAVQSDRRFGGATITFLVEGWSLDEKWQITLTLREINADVFDGVFAPASDQSVVSPSPVPPAVGSPGSMQWALAAVTLSNAGASVPALEITGSASDNTAVEEIIFEYWKSDGVINPVTNPDDPPWVMEGSHAPTTTKVDITSIQGGQVYYAAVTYVVSGIPGDRRVLGPVTAASIDVSGQVTPLIDAAVGKLAWKPPVRAKTTAALAANTYANGTAGVGATLTATANGALAAQDGVTLVATDRLLVDHEATASHNGIYKLTQVGDGSHPYILTRTTDADEAGDLVNATVKVSEGTVAADQEWQCTTNAAITVGTTALVWAKAGGGGGIFDSNWFNIKDYGALVDGSTDDTAAVQAAIDACATAGGGTVFFPRGTGACIIGGALQDTSRSNAQVLFPRRSTAVKPITILLTGECPPPSDYSVVGAEPVPDSLSVIKGTLNTASGTAPCMFGAHGPVGSFDDFSNVNIVLRDLTFRLPADPALTAVDCSLCVQLDADNILIDAGNWNVSTIALQSTAASYGLRTPGRDNGASTRLGIVTVIGFYNGLEVGEHTRGLGVNIAGCRQATVWPVQDHASQFDRLLVVWCQKALVFTGQHYFDIQQLDIEHAASGTWVPVYDIDDASNLGHGNLRWHVVKAGVGVDTTFLVNGGTNIHYNDLGGSLLASIDSPDGSITVTNPSGPTADLAVVSAPKWTTPRTLTLSGDATGAVSQDGSANATLGVTLPNIVAPGTYSNATVTVNAKGQVTSISPGSSAAVLPLVSGDGPLSIVWNDNGNQIAVDYAP